MLYVGNRYKGSENASHKNKRCRDGGLSLMPLVAAWNNQLVEKVQEQGGIYRDSVPTRSACAGFKTHAFNTFTNPTSGNILIRLGLMHHSPFMASNFNET